MLGCTNPNASNYDSTANTDDGSCVFNGFELQLRETTSPVNSDGAARVVYAGTTIEATGFTYGWSNGGTTSEITNLPMGPIACTVIDDSGNSYVVGPDPNPFNPANGQFISANTVPGCTNPNATNFNYAANTDDGTCTI